MKINKIWFGNSEEAFYDDRFSEGINIIFSQGLNNRGKTVVCQSIFYALGSEPKFPFGFDTNKDNYYIVEIEHKSKKYIICRRKQNFIIKDSTNSIHIFSSESEFKHYYSEFIYPLPSIIKDGRKSLVYLSLYNQMLYIGQDGKDTSTLYNLTWLNKNDFMNMLYSIKGIASSDSPVDVGTIKRQIASLKEQIKTLSSRSKILKNKKLVASLASYTANKVEIDDKLKKLNEVKNIIESLKKERNRCFSRKIKNEILIEELTGLSRNISDGSVFCMECGSEHIGFHSKKEEISFDVSDTDTQKIIMDNIKKRIEILDEEILETDKEIYSMQVLLKEYLQDKDVTMENLVFSKNDIQNIQTTDEEIKKYNDEINNLSNKISDSKEIMKVNELNKTEFDSSLLKMLNDIFHLINYDGTKRDVELFTKRNEVVSGSESAAFYLAKFYTLAKLINHEHPVIIDDFREKELSSDKEEKVLALYKNITNQVILTCTLKNEEINKYNSFSNINQIDYTAYPDSHIMNKNDVSKLKTTLAELSIVL